MRAQALGIRHGTNREISLFHHVDRVFAAILLICCMADTGHAAENAYTEILAKLMAEQARETNTPGAGAVIVSSDQLLALAVVGVASTRTNAKLQPDSLWHIGSMTKSMTAEALLRSVPSSEEFLSASVADLAPNLRTSFAADEVTMDQLLSHRAGLDRDVAESAWPVIEAMDTIRGQRSAYAATVKADPRIPKERFSYSNAGYVIASAVTENLLELSWEEMITKQVFARHSLTSAGFLAPGYSESGIEPPNLNHGHRLKPGSFWWSSDEFVPVPNNRNGDNPVAMAPAGGVHLSLRDIGTFLQSHLQGLIAKDLFYLELHRARSDDGDYGLGWIIRNKVHFHSGSNLRWMSEMYIYPDQNIAFAIVLNHGDPDRGVTFMDALTAAIRAAHKKATGIELQPMIFESDLGSKSQP